MDALNSLRVTTVLRPSSKTSKTLFTKRNICFCVSSSAAKHTTLVVESFNEHQRLSKRDSGPLQTLPRDGDWSKDQFWALTRSLQRSSRANQILQVFRMWMKSEDSQINEHNYEKVIELLGKEGLMKDATSAFEEFKSFGLSPSLRMYNSIIHGYAKSGKFDAALFYLTEMKQIGLPPEPDTYDGLILAYGKYRMYDEMGLCLKKMELDGCTPDRVTYNLLIQEFARGGLLTRMERVYQSMRTRRIDAESSTLIAMLEAYANFGIVEKMDKIFRRLWKSRTLVKEDLVRKMAEVYVYNYMFSRLDDLANYLAFRTGRTNTVWCLHLLSHACLLSRKGMSSVLEKMQKAKVSWNVTVANITLLAYLKMKDFTRLRSTLSNLPNNLVEPDMVTVGILFDAISIGFDGTVILESWKTAGLLYRNVEMETDPLVLTAFGKGQFLKNCEEAYSSLDPTAAEKKRFTYFNFIDLVAEQKAKVERNLESQRWAMPINIC